MPGNNAEPVAKDGYCCDECNAKVVAPKRLEELKKFKEKKNGTAC